MKIVSTFIAPFAALFLLALLSSVTYAKEETPELEGLTLMDQSYLERHRAFVDELGRDKFGTPIRKNKTDLDLIQRILNERFITQFEKTKFHSLGVILGDLYVKELHLEWTNYTDEYGKSHAVCVPKTSQCLFPVTMISKRGVLGVIPNATKIYERGVELIEDELPRLPYSIKKPKKYEKKPRTYPLN